MDLLTILPTVPSDVDPTYRFNAEKVTEFLVLLNKENRGYKVSFSILAGQLFLNINDSTLVNISSRASGQEAYGEVEHYN